MPFTRLARAAACAGVLSAVVFSSLCTPASAETITVGWHVPWAAGGQVLGSTGASEHPREWPSVPVKAIRLWDTRTAWLHLEPGRDNYQWGALDAQLSAAREHGVNDVTLVLWGTPKWAAESLDENDAPWLGTSSASPVKNLDDWEQYVRMVVGRYKGQIRAYEIGNEPNLRWFWRGSPEQLAQMVARATKAIKEADPAAIVIAPAPSVASVSDVARAVPYWQAMAQAGAQVDAVSVHWYPVEATSDQLGQVVAAVRQGARTAGLLTTRVWVTEVGFQGDGGVELASARKMPAQAVYQATASGVERLYWYAWTGDKVPGVLPIRDGSVLGEAIKALG